MTHNFPEQLFFNKIDNNVKLSDFKAGIQVLEELEEMPTLIGPCVFLIDLFGHLFLVERKVFVGDELAEKSI